MSAIDYLIIGNVTADLTPEGRILGGTAAYAARTAAAFGLRVGLVTSAASHEPLLDSLADIAIAHKLALHTTTFENIYTDTGRVQYLRANADRLGWEAIPTDWQTAPLVHLAPIAGELDLQIASAFPAALTMLTLQGCLRRWDADGRVHFKALDDVAALKAVQAVVFSEEDIAAAPQMEASIANAAHCVIVTRAERGGTLYIDGIAHPYSSPQVELVHPTGAGDVFAAAFLASLNVVGGDLAAATHIAAQLGAISVTRVGLESAPLPSEVQAVLAEAALPINRS